MTSFPIEIAGVSHSFDIGIAETLGLEAAIIYNHISYWLEYNKRKGQNQYDGRTWMHDTCKSLSYHLTYLSEHQIWRAVDKLVEHGILIKGHYNKNKFDRTSWYALKNEQSRENSKNVAQVANLQNANRISATSEIANMQPLPTYTDIDQIEEINTAPTPSARRKKNQISFCFEKYVFTGISPEDFENWKVAYPAIDLKQEIAKATAWCMANPKAKSYKNWSRFLNSWFSNANEKALNRAAYQSYQKPQVDRRTKNQDGTPMDAPHLEGLF